MQVDFRKIPLHNRLRISRRSSVESESKGAIREDEQPLQGRRKYYFTRQSKFTEYYREKEITRSI